MLLGLGRLDGFTGLQPVERVRTRLYAIDATSFLDGVAVHPTHWLIFAQFRTFRPTGS